MALPQLYRDITLCFYDRIRFRNDEPEGWGSASPFSMGLNALITRPYATLVRSIILKGEWKEPELEELARFGRVPDSSMMLNIAVRAAIDRMTNLESFRWELNTKMLETVYIGLAQLPRLQHLWIRFPTSRHPRPLIVLPPMPHLRSLAFTHIDPLCYPDDISTILARSRNLRELTLHWSRRMREEQEPSVAMHDYFRKCILEKSPLKLRKLSLYNLYARHSDDLHDAVDMSELEDFTFISAASYENGAHTSFVDRSWVKAPPPSKINKGKGSVRSIRHDTMMKDFFEYLVSFEGLEKLYFVNPMRTPIDQLNNFRYHASLQIDFSPSVGSQNTQLVHTSPNPHLMNHILQMRDQYFGQLLTKHGATLKHLLLPSRWPLSGQMIARLVRSCPNLKQLAIAAESDALHTCQLLIPFLGNLSAMRVMLPVTEKARESNGVYPSQVDILNEPFLEDRLSKFFGDQSTSSLQIVGFGCRAWVLGKFYTVPVEDLTGLAESEESSQSSPATGSSQAQTSTSSTNTTTGCNSPSWTVTHMPPNSNSTGNQRDWTSDTTQTSHSATMNGTVPRSSLGKRPRRSSPSSPSSPTSPSPAVTIRVQPPPPPPPGKEDPHEVIETLPGGKKVAWRRQVRRATWEDLKKWEIWALDTHEL